MKIPGPLLAEFYQLWKMKNSPGTPSSRQRAGLGPDSQSPGLLHPATLRSTAAALSLP